MSVTADKATTAISYATGAGMSVLGFSFNEWLALGGFVLMFLTFCVNSYYKHKHYKLAERREDKS